MDALVPRVATMCVTTAFAVPKPRTAATATTPFTGFVDGTAFGAYGADDHCRKFAGLDALKPPVTSVSIAGTSTVLIPSTSRSATTGSAGCRERAALCARHRIRRCGDK